MHRQVFLALAVAAAAAPSALLAQSGGATKPAQATTAATSSNPEPTASPGKTTLSGVYTRDEAAAGKEIFAGLCASCHPIAQHANGIFRAKWSGRSLADLFTYVKTSMPKSDPGSLADEDYAVLVAYVLQANQMPPGRTYLSTDTLELRKIRFDTVRAVRKP